MTARLSSIRRWSAASIARLAAVGIGAVLLAWLCFAVSVAAVVGDGNPELALRWAPFDSRARANHAFQLLEQGSSPQARAEAERALANDPTAVAAARTLGLIADIDGDAAKAAKLFAYSEQLSRRDLPTQLWLIEAAVARDDALGALDHFDKALRTSQLAPSILFPVLLSALDDSEFIVPVAEILSRNPGWRASFIIHLINEGQALRNISLLITQVGLPIEKKYLLDRLAAEGEHDLAWSVFQRARRGAERGVRNGDFSAAGNLTPFDWAFAEGGDAIAERGIDEEVGAGEVLFYSADSSPQALIARQLIGLGPGRYQLAARSGGRGAEGETTPEWSVRCAEGANRELLRSDVANAEPSHFEVPAGCRWQWLVLEMPAMAIGSSASGWVDGVTVVPAQTSHR